MKICILADSHDNRALLKHAVHDAIAQGAEVILHCGDLVAPSTLSILRDVSIPMHVIHGNNTGDLYALMKLAADNKNPIVYHGQDADLTLANRRIFVVHYPHYAEGMASTGRWDLVCCGHSHKAGIKSVDNVQGSQTLIINPGTVGAVANPPTYVLGDLNTLTFNIIQLDVDWLP